MVLYPNKLPESERVCFGICKNESKSQQLVIGIEENKVVSNGSKILK